VDCAYLDSAGLFQYLESGFLCNLSTDMKIQLGGLSEGIHRYRLESEPSEVGLGEHFTNVVVVHATLDKTGNRVFLQAKVEVAGTFTCDRCVVEYEMPVRTSYRMYYVVEASETEGIDPSEIQIVPPGFMVIDLSEDVRQTVLLAVPLKSLCTDQCKGLCPTCGTNLNTGTCDCVSATAIDPRWDKLQSIRFSNTQD
jgi:uncharacterized protein